MASPDVLQYTSSRFLRGLSLGASSKMKRHTRTIILGLIVILASSTASAYNFTTSLTGPQTGVTGEDLIFLADVGGTCGALSSSRIRQYWEWSTQGGLLLQQTHPRNSQSQVTIRWLTPGQKDLAIYNAACDPDASASLTVLISEEQPPLPPLKATFTLFPVDPEPGQLITLDATTSQGEPSLFEWTFGDGTTAIGPVVQKSYPVGGSYDIGLKITRVEPDCGASICVSETHKTLEVGYCHEGFDHICLNRNRFRVRAEWKSSATNTGVAFPVKLTPDTGYFWFFRPENIELMVKILDACIYPFESYWVFASGLTNVEVELEVFDAKEGRLRIYTNPQGTVFEPITDTNAFYSCP